MRVTANVGPNLRTLRLHISKALTYLFPRPGKLLTKVECRLDIGHRPRHHSDIEFSELGWRALTFVKWQRGFRSRSQAVNAALAAHARQLGMSMCGAPRESLAI